MINLRPVRHLILSRGRSSFSPLSSSLSFSKLSLTFPQTLISRSHYHNRRSSPSSMADNRPSAFDFLMSNARKDAASSKKNPPPSSPKIRKKPEPISQNPNSTPSNTSSDSPQESVAKSSGNTETDLRSTDSAKKESKGGVSFKKPRIADADLDLKIGLLKKKDSEFVPEKLVWWDEGQKTPFLFLAKALDLVSEESSRIEITLIVSNLFRTIIAFFPDDLLSVVYLLANKISPAHVGLELGIGESLIIKVLAEACGVSETYIKNKFKDQGDLGLVARSIRSSQSTMLQPPPLTIAKVFDTFRNIANSSGKDSMERKKNYIKSLIVAAVDCEPVYLVRLLQTKLRIGLAQQTLLAALGQAAVHSEKHSVPPSGIQSPSEEAAKIIKQVYSVCPDYDKIIPALLSGGVWELPKTCNFTVGVPIGPMLAKPTNGVSEILEKFQGMEFTCEYKYDGERAQIHYLEDGKVEIYSRNAERNTEKFADVVLATGKFKKPSVSSFVLDCEVVAIDRETQNIRSFQTLSTRARKNVVLSEIKVQVCIFAFDLLYLNGKSLLHEQLDVRRKHLYESFVEDPGFFKFAKALTSSDVNDIEKFLQASIDDGCEGLMIKTLNKDATYEPSKRSNNWVKLKKDYMKGKKGEGGVGDSLDLVPIGGFYGQGKRAGYYGAFVLACYDSSNEEYQSICKIGTGFSDADLKERSKSLKSAEITKPKSYYRHGDTLRPDVWFEPAEVWEVKAADLTVSPVYQAAISLVKPDKGISLRFPRLIRVRKDKSPEDATTSQQVAEMYSGQKNNHQEADDEGDDASMDN